MSMQEDAVKVLNELIQTSEDGKKGFEAAATRADDPGLKRMFHDRALSCASAASELQNLVRSLGGKPASSGTFAGAAHRRLVKARAAAGDANVAVLDEVERGEDVAKSVYARALRAHLPGDVKRVVEQQYHGVLTNHDRVRDLRNQYRAHR